MDRKTIAGWFANFMRRHLRIVGSSISITTIAKHYDIDVSIRDFVPEIEGVSVLANDTAAIAVNSNLNTQEAVEVFLHEVFHIILGMMNLTKKTHVYMKLHSQLNDELECVCDYFSRMVLMPEKEFIKAFNQFVSIDDLAKQFNVSILSVIERMGDLNLTIPRLYDLMNVA